MALYYYCTKDSTSDIELYPMWNSSRIVCRECPLDKTVKYCYLNDATEALKHIVTHQEQGHKVPILAIHYLVKEAEGDDICHDSYLAMKFLKSREPGF
jgi:uncharacterized membrane-anchored protein